MDAQLFSSYNQQLFISIFNIINSYDNQRYTIWKEINYLQYFYHLFPIHVDKFYYTFHGLINPHIDNIKSHISGLSCYPCKIPSYVSALSGFNRFLSYGRVFDLQVLVQQHKRALDQVITQIRQKLCEGIKHIEDVLDNVTGDQSKGLPGMMEKVYNDLSKEAQSIEITLKSLWFHLDFILRKFIEGIHSRISIDTAYYTKNLQASYYSYMEGLPLIKDLVMGQKSTNKKMIRGGYIRRGAKFKDSDKVYLRKYDDALTEIHEERGRINSINSFVETIKVSHGIITSVRKSLEAGNNKLEQKLKSGDQIRIPVLSEYLSLLEQNIRYMGVLKGFNLTIKPLSRVIGAIKTLKSHFSKVHELLSEDYLNFVKQLPGLVGTPAGIESQFCGLKESLENITRKIRKCIGYRTLLTSIWWKIEGLKSGRGTGFPTGGVKSQTNILEWFSTTFDDIKGSIDQLIGGIDSDFKVDGIQMEEILKGPRNTVCKIKEQLETELKEYIRKLKAVKAIEPHMDSIKKKREEISSLTSEIVKITKVESGIDQLKKIQNTMKDFGFVATDITSLEHAYNSEATSLEDIDVSLGYLKGITINTRKVRSDIESYIDFLEKIKGHSSNIKSIESHVKHVPSIKTIEKNLKSQIQSFNEELSLIRSGISDLVRIGNEISDLKLMKSKVVKIRDKIEYISKHLRSISGTTMSLNNMYSSINHIINIITWLDWIGSSIESSSSELDSTGISYKRYSSSITRESVRSLLITDQGVKIVNSNIIQPICEKIQSITSEINSLEQKICSFMNPFLICSNKSITDNTKESTKRLLNTGVQGYNNEMAKSITHTLNILGSENDKYVNVWTLLSNMAIVESKFVITRLYEYYMKRKKILMTLQYANNCRCVYVYKMKHKDDHPYQTMTSEFIDSKEHLSFHMKELRTEGNHLCLCLVIIYHLYPNLIRCFCYFRDLEFDILSTTSRKFHKYTHSSINKIEISKLILFVIDLYKLISDWIEFRNPDPSKLSGGYTCFCSKYEDVFYKYFITTMIYISFLVENMFDHPNETTKDSIQSLSILVNELSSYGQPTQDKCQSPQRTERGQCTSVQTPKNIILVELYKSLVSIFGQNIYLLKSGGIYFLLGLKLLVDKLSIVSSILNPMISYNLNNSIVDYFVSIKETIIIHKDKGSELLSFYQFFSMLSFTLINSKCLCKATKEKVKEVTILVSSVYISIIGNGGEKKKDNECFFKEPADRIMVGSCISLIYYCYNDISLQLSNKVVLDFMVYSEECKKQDEIAYYLTRRTISYPENMSKSSRTNRIVDSTSGISNKEFEGGSNNDYSYNDAYRINTRRAHGSLKYIIIKIVLILIIVVMTIFIRVKIETDDDCKIENLLVEENGGMCQCNSEGTENGGEKDPVPYITNKHFQIALKNSRKSVEKSDVQLYESFKNKHME